MNNQKCIECGERFVGRVDKKFCGPQCRSQYHNRLNSDRIACMRNINNRLRKNNRILLSLHQEGKRKVHRDILLELGFNFTYFTNEYVTQKGKVYRFCYDRGYLQLDEYYYAVVLRKEYVS